MIMLSRLKMKTNLNNYLIVIKNVELLKVEINCALLCKQRSGSNKQRDVLNSCMSRVASAEVR